MKWKDWDRNLRIRLFGEGTMNLLFWAYFPFMTIYFDDAFGKGKTGMLIILSQAFSVIASLVGGYCADRFGRKRMMVLASSSQFLTFLIFAYANSPWLDSPVLTFISFSLLGVWGALYWPASHAMVADVVPEKHRTSVFAVFYTSINIAVVVGPILGSFVFYSYRFEMLVVGAILNGIVAFVLQKYLSETTVLKERKASQKTSWYKAVWEELSDYRVIARDKTFLLFIIAGVLVAQTFMQLDLLIAVYTSEVVENQQLFAIGDWDVTVSGEGAFALVLAENGLLVALFTVYISRVISRWKERNVFILSCLLYALGISLYGLTESIWVFMIAVLLFTIGELIVVGSQESFVAKLAPDHMRGQYFSAASLRFTIGKLIAPISLVLTNYFSYSQVFAFLGFLSLLSAGTYYIMFKRIDKETEAAVS
ncbi:MFS transporter [Radiobacillus kanasensis]|uniref:MDR family MFS transporter n=1 Tax=Radiobacillus kanasensis TaxID=2844358 RepID=UPI001E585137|nr:MFS transporter [Radiobacillus kanasensis]UFU00480.1 MFS transporter [Radiobacillus kanasensis]